MPQFVGGPLDGREIEQRVIAITVAEYRDVGSYAIAEDAEHGVFYQWRVYGERRYVRPPSPPKPSRRSVLAKAAKARKLARLKATLAAKEAADAQKIDAVIAASEASRRRRPATNDRVLWDGTDTKYEATLHCPPPGLDAVGWLLDQPEWITPSLFLPRRGPRHVAIR